MKNITLLITLTLFLSGCITDTLDRKPLNLISDADVWQSEELIDIYLVPLYDAIPIGFSVNYPPESVYTDEATYREYGAINNYGDQPIAQNTSIYTWIRRANYFLDKIETADIPEEDKKSLIAEVRFIRAYYYFDLVKKYGGMPIINEVQSFNSGTGDIEELLVSRNKEDEVYKYLSNELDKAIADLPSERNAQHENRATKSSALALKSRAMLYAGSIAKYGNVQQNGLVGIPTEEANEYFEESLNASNKIIQSGKFSLYNNLYDPATESGDPVANFQNIFLDEGNKEIIFQKAYNFPDKAHSYDNQNVPEGYTTNNGSTIAPSLEIVESFEYIDGSKGNLKVEGKVYNSPNEIFRNKDPRFEATILHGGSTFGQRSVQIYRGIYDEDGTLHESLNPFPADPSKRQVGLDGPFSTGNYGKTGFYIKKYLNTNNVIVEPNNSDQNYIAFRYAEILLNYAEAAFELGNNLPQALEAINKIRSRAGISSLELNELNISKIRHERKVELAFEDKRFWDIKRWRVGTELFKSTYIHGLWPYLKYENGTYKYIYEIKKGFPIDKGYTRTFEQRDYYSNLSSYTSSNKNMINNPGW